MDRMGKIIDFVDFGVIILFPVIRRGIILIRGIG
jgi:hypothetical protein